MGRKNKFTLEERISICKNYLEMGLTHKDIHIKYGVSNRIFYQYINRIHNIEVLKEIEPIFLSSDLYKCDFDISNSFINFSILIFSLIISSL